MLCRCIAKDGKLNIDCLAGGVDQDWKNNKLRRFYEKKRVYFN